MNYTPEQISEIVLKVLKEVNTPDLSKLFYVEKRELAENSNTPPETLILLAKDENYDVRCRVAENSNTPPETLILLAKDKDSRVRYWVAENSNTPQEALIILAKDKDCGVRRRVENNPSYKPLSELKVTAKQYEALKNLVASSQDDNLKSIQF